MTISQDLNSMNPSPYWCGYIIDLNPCGINQVFRLSASTDYTVGFGSYGTFIPFPIQATGFENTGGQAPQPVLTISNATKVIQPYVQQYNDLVRAKVTRIRTLTKYLDSGSSPDDTQHMPVDVYYIEQKTKHDKFTFTFKLANALDLPFVKLPLSQVLKDDTGNAHNLYAPGLSSVRFR